MCLPEIEWERVHLVKIKNILGRHRGRGMIKDAKENSLNKD
jgi:hypothetical protein